MKPLNQKAERIFHKLTTFADGESSHTIDTTSLAFMPVHVERIYRSELGPVYSIAHYYKQNGDMVCDPDMTFLVADTDGRVYPLTFEQGGMSYQVGAEITEDGGFKVRRRMQRDQATFAGQWMVNINNQQDLKAWSNRQPATA